MKILSAWRRVWPAEEFYVAHTTRWRMSERAKAIRNIVLFGIVYAGLWWIAVEVVK